jgi:hypothetical protein
LKTLLFSREHRNALKIIFAVIYPEEVRKYLTCHTARSRSSSGINLSEEEMRAHG